jgi:hypothetical protein
MTLSIPRWQQRSLLLLALLLAPLSGSLEGRAVAAPPAPAISSGIETVTAEAWQRLAGQTIFFGHQSLGEDILNGLRDVMAERPEVRLNIVETREAADLGAPVLAHTKVGKNRDPGSKNRDFAGLMDQGMGGQLDVAFFKYCYIDANPDTDPQAVFADYQATLKKLQADYPQTRFFHVTMPLTVNQSGPKAWLKGLLGKDTGAGANVRRNQFNQLLLRAYGGKQPVFDLAKVESTRADGGAETFDEDGQSYRKLVADYARDGRHLNERGRKWVAEHLLVFLAGLPES